MCLMNTHARHSAALTLLILGSLFSSGCTTPKGDDGEIEPPVTNSEHAAPGEAAASIEKAVADGGSKQEGGEIPLAVAESEHAHQAPKEIVVQGNRSHDAAIHDLVAEARTRLRDVELQY